MRFKASLEEKTTIDAFGRNIGKNVSFKILKKLKILWRFYLENLSDSCFLGASFAYDPAREKFFRVGTSLTVLIIRRKSIIVRLYFLSIYCSGFMSQLLIQANSGWEHIERN